MRIKALLAIFSLCLVGCSDDILNEASPTGPSGEPAARDLGLRLVPPEIELNLDGLSQAQIDQIAYGSYLVNGAAGCVGCHNSSTGEHLAGGNEFSTAFLPPDIQGNMSLFARNLTPDPETGMKLTEAQFIESMQTGKDFHDTEASGQDSRMLFMPVQAYRFMLEDDLKAIYAYLKRIPPVRKEFRLTFIPPFPFPSIPLPPLPTSDAQGVARGLNIPQVFSSGDAGTAFATQFTNNISNLSSADQDKIGRGSYLVNAIADCNNCHTDGIPDGNFDGGTLPGTLDISTPNYLAGGVNLAPFFQIPFAITSRNLTPHPETGMKHTEAQFIETMRFGSDIRRPNGSLRIQPHFPAEFRMTLEDLQAIYLYLRNIPAIDKKIEVVEN